MEFEFIEYLGEGQALLKLPDEVRYGPAAVGGKVAVKTTSGESRMYRLVDAHVSTGLVILGPLLEEPKAPVEVKPVVIKEEVSGEILHEWKKDEDGDVMHLDLGGYHDGPECVRCGVVFCRHCEPSRLTELCEEQTPYLF